MGSVGASLDTFGRVMCDVCRKANVGHQTRQRARHRANGKCICCGMTNPTPEFASCPSCRKKYREAARVRRTQERLDYLQERRDNLVDNLDDSA